MPEVSPKDVEQFRAAVAPLIGVQFDVLRLPKEILTAFEPSQIGTIVGALMDACIPVLPKIAKGPALENVGLKRHPGQSGEREGYPDYEHTSGLRAELKLLYVDPKEVEMKECPTAREASARLTQKVTVKNVDVQRDVLLVLAYQLQADRNNKDLFVPTVIDIGVFSMIDCVRSRDKRLTDAGGRWFGDYQTPVVLSRRGREKLSKGHLPDATSYGRKEAEGKDYNEDTNFGKLKRVPYPPLQEFLKKFNVVENATNDAEPEPIVDPESPPASQSGP